MNHCQFFSYFKSSFWCIIIMSYFLFIFVNKCSLINFWMLWWLIKQHTQVFVLHIFLVLYLLGEFYCVLLDKVWSILPALDLLPLELSRRRGSNSKAVNMDQTWSIMVCIWPMPVVLCLISHLSCLPIQGKTALHNPECL